MHQIDTVEVEQSQNNAMNGFPPIGKQKKSSLFHLTTRLVQTPRQCYPKQNVYAWDIFRTASISMWMNPVFIDKNLVWSLDIYMPMGKRRINIMFEF